MVRVSDGRSDDVLVSVSRFTNWREQLHIRLPRQVFDSGLETAARTLTVSILQGGGEFAIPVEMAHLQRANDQHGHVAGVSPGGHIQGWTTKDSARESELPVNVEVDGSPVYAVSDGIWYSSAFRRFDVPLPHNLPTGRFMPVSVTSVENGTHFARSPFFVARHGPLWIVASPMFRKENTLTGAIQVAAFKNKPVSVELESGTALTEIADCVHPAPNNYNFNNSHCAFILEIPPHFVLEGAAIVLKHAELATDCVLDIKSLIAD